MLYTHAPVSTLHAKVTLKRSPYSNTAAAVRIVADTYPTFTSNKAQYFVDLQVDSSMQDVKLALANLQTKCNALRVTIVMNPALGTVLINRNKTVA